MLKGVVERVENGEHLLFDESYLVMKEILKGEDPELISRFLIALREKGETEKELLGFIQAIREEGRSIEFSQGLLDIVGTGGDGANTLNISTASAILAASCGIPVAKHGNRAQSSKCGSADVLEALKIDLEMSEEDLKQSMKKLGISFLFAPGFHPSLKKMKEIRSKIKGSTVFNLLGPLLNPAKPDYYMLGVANRDKLEFYAKMFQKMGVKKALVFHGNGLDEISTLGVIEAREVTPTEIRKVTLDPEEFGFSLGTLSELEGGDPQENAERLVQALMGRKDTFSDTLIFNTGVALYITGKSNTIRQGIKMANEALQSNKAMRLLEEWIIISGGRMKNYLYQILRHKRKEIAGLKKKLASEPDHPIRKLMEFPKKRSSEKSFKAQLKQEGISVIAEVKKRSPSKGKLADIPQPMALVSEYVSGGATAISILTDKKGFGGSPYMLKTAAKELTNSPVAVLRKDFIIDPVQIAESVHIGADAILLIVSILQEKTAGLFKFAKALGLDVLVEIQDERELNIALKAGADIIAINNRNLGTFEVDCSKAERLLKKIPEHIVTVAASGLNTPEDVKRMKQAGFDAVLVGEALVKSPDPRLWIEQATTQKNDVLIKICGITDPRTAYLASVVGVDLIGVVFYKGSKRFVGRDQAKEIVKFIRAGGAEPVAMFVDSDADEMRDIIEEMDIKMIQLHGEISKREHKKLPKHVQRIFAVKVTDGGDVIEEEGIEDLDPVRDYLLFDRVEPGSGKSFSWENFSYKPDMKWFLSGGLKPGNVDKALTLLHPNGVDVSSGVEKILGKKDISLIEEFIFRVTHREYYHA